MRIPFSTAGNFFLDPRVDAVMGIFLTTQAFAPVNHGSIFHYFFYFSPLKSLKIADGRNGELITQDFIYMASSGPFAVYIHRKVDGSTFDPLDRLIHHYNTQMMTATKPLVRSITKGTYVAFQAPHTIQMSDFSLAIYNVEHEQKQRVFFEGDADRFPLILISAYGMKMNPFFFAPIISAYYGIIEEQWLP